MVARVRFQPNQTKHKQETGTRKKNFRSPGQCHRHNGRVTGGGGGCVCAGPSSSRDGDEDEEDDQSIALATQLAK